MAKLLTTVAVIIVLGVAIGGYFFIGISDTLDREVNREVETTTELHTTVYRNWFDNRRGELTSIIQSGYISSNDTDVLSPELARAASRSGFVTDYHLVEPATGRVLGSSESDVVGRDLYATDVDESLVRNSSRFVLPERYQVFGTDPVVLLKVGTSSYTDRLLVAEIDPGRTPDLPYPIEGGSTHVVNRNGTVVFGEQSLSFAPGSAPRRPTTTRKGDTLYAYRQIPQTELVLVTRTPASTAFAVKEQVLLSFALTLVLLFGVLTAVGLASGEATLRDVTRLASKSREIAAGDLDVDLSNDREDEVGVLYDSFAGMRDALRDRIREAEAARESAQEARAELATRKDEIEEQRAIISVLNRVLRHNLRNDLTVVASHLDFVSRKLDETTDEEHVTVIERKLDELVDRADKAREIEQLTREGHRSLTPVDIGRVIGTEVERFREIHPDATIEVEASETTTAKAHEAIEFVVANLVENAIEHNDVREPYVSVTTRPVDDDWIRTDIADNGPGIPGQELQTIEEGYETAIEHGSGLGLWLVNWLVNEMDGTLEFADRDPHGTAVTVRLRRTAATSERQQAEIDLD